MFVFPSFFHASCVMYIRYQCFHSVNLTLHTVTSIRSRQLKNKIQLESRKQARSTREREKRERETKLARKNLWGKEPKKGFDEKVVDVPYLKVILTLLLENISSEILHAYAVVNEWWSIINLFSDWQINWSYSWSSFIRSI